MIQNKGTRKKENRKRYITRQTRIHRNLMDGEKTDRQADRQTHVSTTEVSARFGISLRCR